MRDTLSTVSVSTQQPYKRGKEGKCGGEAQEVGKLKTRRVPMANMEDRIHRGLTSYYSQLCRSKTDNQVGAFSVSEK